VCQVTTTGQIQTHNAIMGLQQGCVNSKVCRAAEQQESSESKVKHDISSLIPTSDWYLPARVRLHIDSPMLRVQVKSLQSSGFAQVFDLVDVVVAPVIPGSRLSFRILVGQTRSQCFNDRH